MRQNYGKGFFGLPGGVVDAGELPLHAAVREAREEVGVHVHLDHLIGLYLLQGGDLPDIFASVFYGHVVVGRPHIVDEHEIADIVWAPPLSPPVPLLPDATAALEDFTSGKRGVVREVWRTVQME